MIWQGLFTWLSLLDIQCPYRQDHSRHCSRLTSEECMRAYLHYKQFPVSLHLFEEHTCQVQELLAKSWFQYVPQIKVAYACSVLHLRHKLNWCVCVLRISSSNWQPTFYSSWKKKGKKKVCSMKRLANRGHETESNIAYAPLSSTIKVPNDGFQIPVICSAEASCTVRGVRNRRLHKHCAHAKHETGHSRVTSSIRYSMTQCPCNYSS